MTAHFFQSLLVAFIFIVVMMAMVFVISQKIHNAGIVDVAWSMGFFPVALIYSLINHGAITRKIILVSLVAAWSLRLGGYLAWRAAQHHPEEDRRYQQLREEWGVNAQHKMFWFFQFQGVLLVLLTIPFLLICLNREPDLQITEWIGMSLWCVAMAGETIADRQLAKFKSNPTRRGLVCQEGLWRYSRHPNYFFEWLIWGAYFIFALGSPWGWISFFAPLLMLFFLVKVTGIPMTEALAVKTKGEEYRAYQQTTSAFVPWFRKTNSPS